MQENAARSVCELAWCCSLALMQSLTGSGSGSVGAVRCGAAGLGPVLVASASASASGSVPAAGEAASPGLHRNVALGGIPGSPGTNGEKKNKNKKKKGGEGRSKGTVTGSIDRRH